MKNLFVFLLAIVFSKVFSQNVTLAELNRLMVKDSSSIPLLFSYSDSVRDAILMVSTYPQGLVKLEEVQKKSSASFKSITSKYNRTKQKQLWEMIRYPELITLVIQNSDKSSDELKGLLKNYPDGIQKSTIEFAKKDHGIFVEMDNVRKAFELNYTEVVKDFPEDVKKSFNVLLHRPELIAVLSEDIKTTIALGDVYKSNPKLVKHVADSLNAVIAKQNSTEYEDWKRGISKDVQVQKELKDIANKYEQEEGDVDDVYSDKKYDITIYQIMPYPYWAGYPYWYKRPYWYPYPWWYHLGFYWYPDGTIIFGGMPTYYFGWWYYNNPRYHYPKTSDYFHQHYQIHKRSTQGFNQSIRESQQPTIKRKR